MVPAQSQSPRGVVSNDLSSHMVMDPRQVPRLNGGWHPDAATPGAIDGWGLTREMPLSWHNDNPYTEIAWHTRVPWKVESIILSFRRQSYIGRKQFEPPASTVRVGHFLRCPLLLGRLGDFLLPSATPLVLRSL